MSHVFISYVHDDKNSVDQLARDLQLRGIEVWLDRERIRPGERWKDVIRKAIRDGDFFYAASPQAMNQGLKAL